MRTTPFRTAFLLLPFSLVAAHSAPIQNLTFTEVIKEVFVIDPATKKETPAKTGDKLIPPNVLKTGADSRAELVAEDKTVTRVGSNTIFSVEANSRDVNLAQGSVLFHSPAGRGGGRIKSAGATASVLGTTLAVSANSDGGFKTSLLEGKGEVKDPKGGKVGLVAGQVTFAKPGGGLSPALNFDLKAQIASSKLVGGFAAPLASIAKIEAAVAIQQAKIEGGGLTSTGLLIGDRPDTAFKVDATIVDGQVRQAQTRRIEQEKATKETQTFYPVDPRYIERVLDDTRNSLLVRSADQDTSELFFYIDGTGRAVLQQFPNAIGGVPKSLPSWEREETPYAYYAIIQKNIDLELNVGSANSEKFLAVAADPDGNPPGSDRPNLSNVKMSGGLVALENVILNGNIDFYNLDNVDKTDDVETGLALLISAGRTVEIAEGSTISTKASQFEIFAGGTSYSKDLDLAQRPLANGEKPLPLSLRHVSLINDSEGSAGLVRISAPEMQIVNSLIKCTSENPSETYFPEIAMFATGAVTISTDTEGLKAFKVKSEEKKTSLPLGFSGIDKTLLTAFKIGIESKSDVISISSVDFAADDVGLRAGKSLTLTDLVVESSRAGVNYPASQIDFKATAVGSVTLNSLNHTKETPVAWASLPSDNRAFMLNAAGNVTLSSDLQNVSVNGLAFGDTNIITSPSGGSDSDPTNRVSISAGGSILLNNSAFATGRVTLTADNDIRIENYSKFFTSGGFTSGTYAFSAKAKNSLLLSNTTITSTSVLFDGDNVNLAGLTVNPNSEINPTRFEARALNELLLNSSAIVSDTLIFEGKTVKFAGVSVESVDLEKSSITVNSDNPTHISGVSRFTAYNITFDAKSQMLLTTGGAPTTSANTNGDFKATAVNDLTMKGVDLRYAQNVALDANTVVLGDVAFKEGSSLSIKSGAGVLSTPVDRNGITKGWVNVLPRVTYGAYDLHDLSKQMDTHGISTGVSIDTKPSRGIPSTNFGAAVQAQFGVALPNLSIAAKQ
jgi:hypothetical protein